MLRRVFAEKDNQGKGEGRNKEGQLSPANGEDIVPSSAPQRDCPEWLRLEGQQSALRDQQPSPWQDLQAHSPWDNHQQGFKRGVISGRQPFRSEALTQLQPQQGQEELQHSRHHLSSVIPAVTTEIEGFFSGTCQTQPRTAAKAIVWLYWHKADRTSHQWSCHWKTEVLEKGESVNWRQCHRKD